MILRNARCNNEDQLFQYADKYLPKDSSSNIKMNGPVAGRRPGLVFAGEAEVHAVTVCTLPTAACHKYSFSWLIFTTRPTTFHLSIRDHIYTEVGYSKTYDGLFLVIFVVI